MISKYLIYKRKDLEDSDVLIPYKITYDFLMCY